MSSVEEQKRKEEIRKKEIAEQIKRDQDEREAERRMRAAFKAAPPSSAEEAPKFTGSKMVVGDDGKLVRVDGVPSKPMVKKEKPKGGLRTLSNMNDADSDDELNGSEDSEEEDDVNDLPPKVLWTIPLLGRLLRRHGKRETENIMRRHGFDEFEIEQYILRMEYMERSKSSEAALYAAMLAQQQKQGAHKEKKKDKEDKPRHFAGAGHRLDSSSSALSVSTSSPEVDPTAPPPAQSTYKLVVDEKAPRVRVKVKLHGGADQMIVANDSHTVRQLFDHIRTLSGQHERVVFTLQQTVPKKIVWEESEQTVKEAGLSGIAVTVILS